MPLSVEVVPKYISVKFHHDGTPLEITSKDAAKWRGLSLHGICAKRALVEGGVGSTVVGVTLVLLQKATKFPPLPLASDGIVVFELTIPRHLEPEFDELIKTKQLETELKNGLSELGSTLQEVFGGKCESSTSVITDRMKNLSITCVERCDKPSEDDSELTASIPGAKPLPPTNLQITYGQRFPNTRAMVFFDDPNDDVCKYVITALDAETNSEIKVEASERFAVVDGLKPNRQYVFFAQTILNDVTSEKSFIKKPVEIFKKIFDVEYEVARESNTVNFTWSKVPSATSYQLKVADADCVEIATRTTEDLGVSVNSDTMRLGLGCFVQVKALDKDGEIVESVKKWWDSSDLKLWNTGIHQEFCKIFGERFPNPRMKQILAECYHLGIVDVEDLKYLKGSEYARQIEKILNPVEISKLRQHNIIPTGEFPGKKTRRPEEITLKKKLNMCFPVI